MGNLSWLNVLNNDASLEESVNQCLSLDLPKYIPYNLASASPAAQWHLPVVPVAPLHRWCYVGTLHSVFSAEGWMRHSPGCPQTVHDLVTLQCQLKFLPGSLGKGVAMTFLDGGQGCGKPTGANVPLPPRWPLGQAVPLQGGHSLAAGQQPALPGIFALPEKSQLPPVQARCDVMLTWYSSSDHSWGCREWIFLFLNPTSTLPIQLEFPLQVLSPVLLLNLKGS